MCLKWFSEQFPTSDERARAEGEMEILIVLDEEVERSSRVETADLHALDVRERSPVADTTLRASFVNLSLDHTVVTCSAPYMKA